MSSVLAAVREQVHIQRGYVGKTEENETVCLSHVAQLKQYHIVSLVAGFILYYSGCLFNSSHKVI